MGFGQLGASGAGGSGAPPWALDPNVYYDGDALNNRAVSGLLQSSFLSSIVCSRGTNAWAEDLSGNYTQFTGNNPRLTAKGLLIEAGRQNYIQNNSMVGAVVGTPGTVPTRWFTAYPSAGISQDVVGTGTENGIDYIDFHYSGTTSAGGLINAFFSMDTGMTALNVTGQVYTGSLFCKLQAGSLTGVTNMNIQLNDVGGSGGTGASTAFTPTGAALGTQRVSVTKAYGATGGTRIDFALSINASGSTALDFTLRIGWPQVERGPDPYSSAQFTGQAYMTSPIRTNNTGIGTRSGEQITLAQAIPYNAAAASFYIEAMNLAKSQTSDFPSMLSAVAGSLGGASDQFGLGDGNLSGISVTVGGTISSSSIVTINPTISSVSAGVFNKIAGRFTAADLQLAVNGVKATAQANNKGTLPTGITQTTIGGPVFFQRINDIWVRRVGIWLQGLSDTKLQSITT